MQRGHRGSTTPMDFEWSNANGPVDPSSPFMNIHSQRPAQKRNAPPTAGPLADQGRNTRLTAGPPSGQTGSHSVLDSPSKSGFATPSRLRDPDNRPFYFSQDASKPLPLPPHVQNTWEPRTPASDYDFSSGGETPTTPAVDSDAGTPDTHLADKMGRLTNGDAKKPARRESWFKRAFGASPSPTKEPRERERVRERDDSRKYYSQKADNRIQKRRTERSERSERSRSKKRMLRDVDDDDDDESDREQHTSDSVLAPQKPGAAQTTYAMKMGSFMHWLEAHPHLPSVLSYYMQLGVNIVLASMFIYIIWCAWSAIISDVDIESSKHLSEVLIDITSCRKQYTMNRCLPEERVPGMEKLCSTWETCMNRDPRKVARASVTAKTFAMIFNSFVEEFSYKSMIFTAVMIFGGFNLSNWAFGLLRTQQQHQHQQHSQNPNEWIPQTPHRVLSNGYIDSNQQNYQQNWQQHTPYQAPYAGTRHIEAPPLVHTQSMPALPMVAQEGVGLLEDRKTPRKKGLFR